MTKYFIDVEATYIPKNKLQGMLLEKVKDLAYTLCDSLELAKHEVDIMFKDTVNAYKGNAEEADPDYNTMPLFIAGTAIEGPVRVTITSAIKLVLLPVRNDQTFLSQTLDN